MNVAQLIALLETVEDKSRDLWVDGACCWVKVGDGYKEDFDLNETPIILLSEEW